MGHGFAQVGAGMLRVAGVAALAAAGAVAASAKVGTSFQAMTELIHTQAGASQDEVDKMRVAIENMVHDVGTSPTELAKGLYHIESVGVRGSAALDILKASALGAKVGLADMESVTNALTAVWFSGIKGAKSMTDAMAILDGIVGVGNMHLQDLTDSFKSGILGTAATYGVDIRSLGAAIATLTDAGVPADIAATRLNNTLTHLAAPTKQAIGVLKDLGLGQFDLAKDLHKPDGLFMALSDLHDKLVAAGEMKDGKLTPQGAADLSKLFGGSRFGATAMQLLTQMDRIQQKYGLITQRSQTFGDNVKSTMETAGFVWGQFKADIEDSAIEFSDGFLPALARAGSKLDGFLVGHRDDIRKLGKDLGDWLDHIDWHQVEDGANTFLAVMKTVLEVVGKIPPQIDALVIGFIGLNKVSGGLLGKGVGNIVGGATGILGALAKAGARGLLSKIPVVGGALAAATSTPVFVTNWPLGFGMGGGLPGIPAAAGAAEAGGLTLGAAAAAAAAGTAVAAIAILGLTALYNATTSQAQKDALQPTVTAQEAYKHSFGTFKPPTTPSSGGMSPDERQEANDAAQALRDVKDASQGTAADLAAMATASRLAKSSLHGLAKGDIKTAMHKLLTGIEERSKAKYGHTLGASAVNATFGRDLLRMEGRLLKSHETGNTKLAGVERLEKIAVAHKDWDVAKKLKADIAALKAQAKTDANKALTAARATTTAALATREEIKDKDLSVTVPITNVTTVSLRDITLRQQTYAKMGRVFAD